MEAGAAAHQGVVRQVRRRPALRHGGRAGHARGAPRRGGRLMGIVPGTEPGPYQEEPLLAEEPLPPGEEQRIEEVDQIAKDVRASGSKEAEAADEKADAVEGEG